MENEEKDRDDGPTRSEIVGYVYEYGLYALMGIAAGLLVRMLAKAFL